MGFLPTPVGRCGGFLIMATTELDGRLLVLETSVSWKRVRSQKGRTKPKNRTHSAKEFSERFEGITGHCPVKQGF